MKKLLFTLIFLLGFATTVHATTVFQISQLTTASTTAGCLSSSGVPTSIATITSCSGSSIVAASSTLIYQKNATPAGASGITTDGTNLQLPLLGTTSVSQFDTNNPFPFILSNGQVSAAYNSPVWDNSLSFPTFNPWDMNPGGGVPSSEFMNNLDISQPQNSNGVSEPILTGTTWRQAPGETNYDPTYYQTPNPTYPGDYGLQILSLFNEAATGTVNFVPLSAITTQAEGTSSKNLFGVVSIFAATSSATLNPQTGTPIEKITPSGVGINGNVGINFANAPDALDINGSFNQQSGLFFNVDSTDGLTIMQDNIHDFQGNDLCITTAGTQTDVFCTDGAGIEVGNLRGGTHGVLQIQDPGDGKPHLIATSSDIYIDTTGHNLIDSTGNFGIGTTTPWRTLSVKGSSDLGTNALAGSFTGTTTATSTLAGGINVTSGCFSISNVCIGGGTVTSVSGTWPIISSGGNTPVLSFGGLSTSSAATVGNIPYFTGVNTFGNVATTTASCSGSTSCSAFTIIGASPVTISSTNSGGTVTSVATNNGLTGGTITTTGTVGLNIASLSTNALVDWNGSNLSATGTPFLTAGAYIGTTTSTSTLAGGLKTNLLNVTSSTASSTFANGINLTNGCFSENGNCINTNGSTNPGGSDTDVQYNSTGSFAGASNFTFASNLLTVPDIAIPGSGQLSVSLINDSSGGYSIDTNGRSLINQALGTRVLNYSVGNLVMNDDGGALAENWDNRQLVEANGSTIDLDWSGSGGQGVVFPNGNVGIGTSTPYALLSVAGTSFSGTSTAYAFINLSKPTIAGGTGDGSVTPSLTASSTDSGGTVTLTTGATPSAGGAIFTITFKAALNAHCTYFPSNALTAALSGTTGTFADEFGNKSQMTAGTVALSALTTYSWDYTCTQ